MAGISYVAIFGAFVVLCSANPVLKSDIHNYFNCPQPEKAKNILLDEPINMAPLWFFTREKSVTFPENTINTIRIACIMIKDLDVDEKGGYPSITDGGIGNYAVTMRFQSQPGKGFNFRVKIYGE